MATKKQTSGNAFYDQWLEQQKDYFQNWTKYTQDMQKSFTEAFPAQGTDLYKQWYDKQLEQFNQLMANMGNFKPGFQGMQFPHMPAMPGFPGAEQLQAQFKDFYEKQQQYFTGMMAQAQSHNPFQHFGAMRDDAMSSVFRLYDNWLEINRQIAKSLANGGEEVAKQLPNGVMAESVKNLFASSDVYIKLLELWVPMMKKLQEETPELDELKDYLKPEKYKEVIDRVFGFTSPDAMQQFYTQAATMVEQLNGTTQANLQKYQEMMAHNSKLLPELMAGDPQAAVKLYENMYEAYSKNVDPQLKSALGGRDGEVMEITKGVIEKVTQYVHRYSEFQHQLYVAGQKAMEAQIEEQHKAFQKNGQPTNFSEFFQQWVEKNQAVYADIFKSKEFTKLQSDLMDSGMDIRSEFQRLMEIYLADYPVVARSEMDDLHKKVQDLQAKLRKLEGGKEVPAAEKPEATPKARTTPAAKKA